MTRSGVPDPDTLAAAIPGPDPAGGPLPDSLRRRLEDARRVIDPSTFAPSDPLRPATRRDPDWNEIATLCESVLTATAKDLHVAARLTEALTELHGFAGLATGLRLLRLLVRDGWDRIYPVPDPDSDSDSDSDARAMPFLWLAEPTRGARFPAKVRLVPLFRTDGASLSWQFWSDVRSGRAKVAFDLDGFLRTLSRRECLARVEELSRCRDELAALDRALADRMTAPPSLGALTAAVGDCLGLAEHLAQRRKTEPLAEPAKPLRPVTESPPEPLAFAVPQDRDELLEQLHAVAEALQKLEPHSPVPHLIFWAVGLARLPLIEAVRALCPELAQDLQPNFQPDFPVSGEHLTGPAPDFSAPAQPRPLPHPHPQPHEVS
jgi:type VI secretion system protein ImpA